jgi:hypothetical protein
MKLPVNLTFNTVRERFIYTSLLRVIQDERGRFADMIPRLMLARDSAEPILAVLRAMPGKEITRYEGRARQIEFRFQCELNSYNIRKLKAQLMGAENPAMSALLRMGIEQIEGSARSEYLAQRKSLIGQIILDLTGKMADEERKLVKLEEGFTDQ